MPFLRQAQGLRPQTLGLSVVNKRLAYTTTALRHASHSNKHKRSQDTRASEAKSRSDSHKAVFGKREKPFWEFITPDFLKEEMRMPSNKGHFAQATSFQWHSSHKAGSKPVVGASTTSWDSESKEVKYLVYDPISGRMVPGSRDQSTQASTSTGDQGDKGIPVKCYQKPTIPSQLAEDDADLSNTPIARATFDEDLGKVYQSEHEELLAARKNLEVLREQVQILERQAHSSLTRDDTLDEERPAVFENGWDSVPQGLQTAYQLEKEAYEHGDSKSLEQELAALNKQSAHEITDDYSTAPSGLQTLFAHEQDNSGTPQSSTLEKEMVAMNNQAPRIDDGYSTEPVGLETSYTHEHEHNPEKLQHELGESASEPATAQITDDGYSTEPIGMQTHYEREEAEIQNGQRQDLEHELQESLKSLQASVGYPRETQFMQTSYEREQDQVDNGSTRSLEEEIQAQQRPSIHNDGYSQIPSGMQTHFKDEHFETGAGKRKSLEHELRSQDTPETKDDSCSKIPIGLETAFDKEQKEAEIGTRHTLEKEMNIRQPSFEDGYSTMPMGLQMLFRREKHDVAQGNRHSLEEDIQQRDLALQYEDGYTCAPMGMQNSFEKEDKVGPDSLEAELKSMPLPGEGDLSPTVGKFANSKNWYKQPATSNFSERSLKADNEFDALANDFSRAINGHDDTHIKSSNTKVSSTYETTALDDTITEHASTKEVDTINEQKPQPDILRKTDNLEPLASDSSANEKPQPNITWADPPLYKVIAYDSGKDAISITTTTTNFSNGETPISIPYTLSQLSQTGRFIPHLASLQNEGFQVIHTSNDFLVLRKVHKDSRSRSSRLGGAINPVDGTSKCQDIESPTARFASPTGFVNHDPIFPPEPVTQAEDVYGTIYDIPTHGRSGTKEHSYPSDKEQHNTYSRFKRHDKRANRSGRWRRRFTWLLSVAAGTAACTYVVGVTSELARPEKHVMRSPK